MRQVEVTFPCPELGLRSARQLYPCSTTAAAVTAASQGIVEDQGLQRTADSITFNAMTIMVETWRPHPQRFSLYKGEFWTILHRSFCEYVHKSPDNVARGLSAYFTGFRISDESYMQTVACHPQVCMYVCMYQS